MFSFFFFFFSSRRRHTRLQGDWSSDVCSSDLIGVAGLVSLGAMAERIVRFIEGGDRFVLGQISVAGRGLGMGTGFTAGGLLPDAMIRRIGKVPGVSGVQAQVMLPLNPSTSQFMTV